MKKTPIVGLALILVLALLAGVSGQRTIFPILQYEDGLGFVINCMRSS